MSQSPATSSDAPRAFGRAFWALNTIEMFERLSYYTLRIMAPVYVMQADDPGGLHLSSADRGVIWFWWSIFQSGLPIITGGIADRYGYKRVMACSFAFMTLGHLMVAFMRDLPFISNFWAIFTAIMVLATGTAFFKPTIQGSLAHSMTKENSSIGWGIFYWIVNIGAFVGHYLPAIFLSGVHTPEAWRNLFLFNAAFSALNFFILPLFSDVSSGADKSEPLHRVLWRTVANVFEPRLVAWLLIMSGFWMMMYQLWDTQPSFITDWVDSSSMVDGLRWLPSVLFNALTDETPRGLMVPQNVLLSLNSTFIIAGVLGMSWLTRRMRTLTAMLGGMLLATAGVVVAGWTMSPWMLCFGILLFSLGEMTTGPKKSEYLALIAPPAKKGLYLGYVNIPVGIGAGIGNWIAGIIYGQYGEKATLALRYLAEKTSLATQPATLATRPATAPVLSPLEELVGVTRPNAMTKLQEVTGLDASAATQLLWDTYTPQYYVWIPFAIIGVVSAVALAIFGQMAKRWKDMNA